LIRKILKNRWLVLSQFFGVLLLISLLSSIPAFTIGVLQKVLIGDLQNFQVSTSKYPGSLSITTDPQIFTASQNINIVSRVDNIFNKLPQTIPLPEVCQSKILTTSYFRIIMPQLQGQQKAEVNYIDFSASEGLQDHINITDGRLPSIHSSYDSNYQMPLYEAIISEQALFNLGLVINKEYVVEEVVTAKKYHFILKIVGTFKNKEENSPFWDAKPSTTIKDIYIDYNLFMSDFFNGGYGPFCVSKWNYYFDYNQLKIEDVGKFLNIDKSISASLKKIASLSFLTYELPCRDILINYFDSQQKMNTIMLSINAPLLFMLALFILMLSMLKMKRERNEISVAASRGAGKMQITAVYFAESLIVALCAMIVGPFLGMLIARFIGASTGFMEFVNRAALNVTLAPGIYIYAVIGALSSVLLTIIPAYTSSSVSVVNRKQSISRYTGKPLWQKAYLDAVLLLISLYGLYVFNTRQRELLKTGLTAKSLDIDPLMFIVPALFMVALGLIFLRLYPFLVELLFKAGKKFWSPGIYASLLQTSRSIVQYGFLSLFLMFTISLGIYSANSARTINMNAEDKIRYSIGADTVVKPLWQLSLPPAGGPVGVPSSASPSSGASSKPEYIVPNFDLYSKLKGVEIATKVYNTDQCDIVVDQQKYRAQMMAITTDEFGKVSWFRNDLLKTHWYNYLNLIAQEPSAILISKSLADAAGLKPGDNVYSSWGDSGYGNFTVYAVIDYWPSWNPNAKIVATTAPEDNRQKQRQIPLPMFVVANFQYVSDRMSIEPWDIWMKLQPNAKLSDLYQDIKDKGLSVTSIVNTNEEIVKLRNSPFQKGINGALTISFCTALLICLAGFILFWALSIKSRELQFGIFRAIGLQSRSVMGMLVLEQLLISGISIVIGTIIGVVTTGIFVRFFNLAYSSYEQVPPFKIITEQQDYNRLFIFIAIMLVIGFAVLSMIVSKIKTVQALKLGED